MRWGLATLMSAIGSQLLVNQFQAHDPLVRRFFLFKQVQEFSVFLSAKQLDQETPSPTQSSKAVLPSELRK